MATFKGTSAPWVVRKCGCGQRGCRKYRVPTIQGASGMFELEDARMAAASLRLFEALSALGNAIEGGDPQQIADLWLGLGKKAIDQALNGDKHNEG